MAMSDGRRVELFTRALRSSDFQRAVTLCHFVLQCNKLPGVICEFGVFEGESAALISSLSPKPLWLFDSFKGLPQASQHDKVGDCFKPGDLCGTIEKVMAQFDDQRSPVIVQGWFEDLKPSDMPSEIAFAHIDCDYYPGMIAALQLVWPRIVPGGIMLIDDFLHPELPGVAAALVEFSDQWACSSWASLGVGSRGEYSMHCWFEKAPKNHLGLAASISIASASLAARPVENSAG